MRPVYRPSLVAPWPARVISMYAGLAGCGVLVVMVGKGVISRDWVSLQGSILSWSLLLSSCFLHFAGDYRLRKLRRRARVFGVAVIST